MSDDIGQAVRDRLAATTEITNVCKPGRIFADVFEQQSPGEENEPAIVVIVPGKTTHEELNSAERCGGYTVQIFAYGKDRAQANSLAKIIRNTALPATLEGLLHGMDWREVSLVDGPSELTEQPSDGSGRWRRLTQQTFSIWANPV